VVRQLPFVNWIPFVPHIIRQGDQVISQLVLQFRVQGDPNKPIVTPLVGSGVLNPLATIQQAGAGVTRELSRAPTEGPRILNRLLWWIFDRMAPPVVHQWKREGLKVLPETVRPDQFLVPGFVVPLTKGNTTQPMKN
jgi:hypothetical protein